MNLKILIIGSENFSLLAKEIMKKIKVPDWIDIEINKQHIQSLIEENKLELNNEEIDPATIVISGEQSASILEKKLNKNVIPVAVNESNLLINLMKSNQHSNIALINYKSNFKLIEQVIKRLSLDIPQYTYQNKKDIHQVLSKVKDKDFSKIFGGSYACEVAEEVGINNEFIYSEESLYQSIETAIRYLNIYKNEMEQSESFKTVANLTDSGIISLDENNNITWLNQKGEKLLSSHKRNITGRNINQWLGTDSIDETPDINQTLILEFNGKTLSVSSSSIYVGDKKTGAILTVEDVKEIEKKELNIRHKMNENTFKAHFNFSDILGESIQIKEMKKLAKSISAAEESVLILGESGTGKELFAQSIHNNSNRKENSFVGINCATIPENILESELFGYEEGAFTGAKKGGKKGLFELAHKGTVFLDEIDSIPFHLQSKLLRVIQEKEIMKVGAESIIPIDLRVITASNNDLSEEVEKKQFRKDLFYRISVLQLFIPPLRERKEDIKQIAKHYFKRSYYPDSILSTSALDILMDYEFPGNIRELENILTRFKVYCSSTSNLNEQAKINNMEQALNVGNNTSKVFFQTSNTLKIKSNEKRIIQTALRRNGGKKEATAKELGISRSTLWRKIKKLQIDY